MSATDWDAINAGPTPSLDEYRVLEKADPNAFWRLDSGHHANLLDAALEEVEQLRAQVQRDVLATLAIREYVEAITAALDGEAG